MSADLGLKSLFFFFFLGLVVLLVAVIGGQGLGEGLAQASMITSALSFFVAALLAFVMRKSTPRAAFSLGVASGLMVLVVFAVA